MGQLTLLLGGARSGKSTFAERLAERYGGHVVYIATAQAHDEEMENRIAIHKKERPSRWQTLEIPMAVGKLWQHQGASADIVLLDCITMLVTNVLLAVNEDPDVIDEVASYAAVNAEISALLETIGASEAHWILVSNEVGLGLVPPYPLGRVYRDALGWANQQLAQATDTVYFLLAGIPMRLQPEH